VPPALRSLRFARCARQDPVQSRFLAREPLLAALSLGGVRLEDNVLVTADGSVSLTDVPRRVDDVQAAMRGAPGP
jgi:Xaa-Pro dipeptidase